MKMNRHAHLWPTTLSFEEWGCAIRDRLAKFLIEAKVVSIVRSGYPVPTNPRNMCVFLCILRKDTSCAYLDKLQSRDCCEGEESIGRCLLLILDTLSSLCARVVQTRPKAMGLLREKRPCVNGLLVSWTKNRNCSICSFPPIQKSTWSLYTRIREKPSSTTKLLLPFHYSDFHTILIKSDSTAKRSKGLFRCQVELELSQHHCGQQFHFKVRHADPQTDP